MRDYKIEKLRPEDYHKCSNIWDMKKYPDRTETWYKQIVDGSREVYYPPKNTRVFRRGMSWENLLVGLKLSWLSAKNGTSFVV